MQDINVKETEIPTVEEYSFNYPVLDERAKWLFMTLENEEVSEDTKELLLSIINETANSANIGITSPEIIRLGFHLTMEQLHSMYREGILDTVMTLIEAALPDDIAEGIRAVILAEEKLKRANQEPDNGKDFAGLAKLLSSAFNHSCIPNELYSAIFNGIQAANKGVDLGVLPLEEESAIMVSPDYIEQVLRSYFNNLTLPKEESKPAKKTKSKTLAIAA